MNLSYEKRLWRKGYRYVAGVDEAGRGPLAGPVVAAAVVFPPQVKIQGLDDSKQLSPKKREELFQLIRDKSLKIGVGRVSHRQIDRLNIGRANLLAMKIAVEKLGGFADHLLIDGARNQVDSPLPQRAINGGDRKCASIAAASIIAKVTRDRIMLRYHEKYPEYRFDRHKGYGTEAHVRLVARFGPCPIHRRSFSPVNSLQGSRSS